MEVQVKWNHEEIYKSKPSSSDSILWSSEDWVSHHHTDCWEEGQEVKRLGHLTGMGWPWDKQACEPPIPQLKMVGIKSIRVKEDVETNKKKLYFSFDSATNWTSQTFILSCHFIHEMREEDRASFRALSRSKPPDSENCLDPMLSLGNIMLLVHTYLLDLRKWLWNLSLYMTT